MMLASKAEVVDGTSSKGNIIGGSSKVDNLGGGCSRGCCTVLVVKWIL